MVSVLFLMSEIIILKYEVRTLQTVTKFPRTRTVNNRGSRFRMTVDNLKERESSPRDTSLQV